MYVMMQKKLPAGVNPETAMQGTVSRTRTRSEFIALELTPGPTCLIYVCMQPVEHESQSVQPDGSVVRVFTQDYPSGAHVVITVSSSSRHQPTMIETLI